MVLPRLKLMIYIKKISTILLLGSCLSLANITLNLEESFSQETPETPPENVSEEPEETPSLTAIDWYNKGVDEIEARNYQGAIAAFSESIKLDPTDADAYYNRGYSYLVLEQFEESINDYNKAIELKSDFAYAYGNRCYAYYKLENHEQAIADCSKAIQLESKYGDFYIYRGNAKDDLEMHEAAILDYNQAITINPNNPKAYYNRLGQSLQAVEDYSKAIQFNTNFADAYHNRGVTRFKLEEKDDAIADLRKAAELFRQQGNTDHAEKSLNTIKQLEKGEI